jgi:uncharacterized membrane protein
MDLMRIARHLFFPRRFPKAAMSAIEQAIARGEATHRAEIRFAAEDALDGPALLAGESARARAVEVFSELGVWDTEENNGVLIYLLLAEHAIEVVADRGLSRHVTPQQWQEIVAHMRGEFRAGRYEEGLRQAVDEVTALLVKHFPAAPGAPNANELPDQPVLG